MAIDKMTMKLANTQAKWHIASQHVANGASVSPNEAI